MAARAKVQANETDEAKSLAKKAMEHFQSKNLPGKIALARDLQQQIRKV